MTIKYRMKSSGEIVTEAEYRLRSDRVFPTFFIPEDADVVLKSPTPIVSSNQFVISDGVMQDNLGNWVEKWSILDKSEEELSVLLIENKRNSLVQINNDDNKIYADVIGNKTTEYLKAAEDARAYKAAGYPEDTVPDYVQSWADAKLWTARQACDDILQQEMMWQGAAKLIRDYRLKAKEAVKRAITIAEVEAAMLIWNSFVTNIRTQLGV